MIFNGAFNDLTVEQCVALLSCFVFQEKVCTPVHVLLLFLRLQADEMPKLTEELSGPLRMMQVMNTGFVICHIVF